MTMLKLQSQTSSKKVTSNKQLSKKRRRKGRKLYDRLFRAHQINFLVLFAYRFYIFLLRTVFPVKSLGRNSQWFPVPEYNSWHLRNIRTPATELVAVGGSFNTSLSLSGYFQGCYASGLKSSPPVYWSPYKRGVLLLDDFKIPKRLKTYLNKKPFDLRINTSFEQIVRNSIENRVKNNILPMYWGEEQIQNFINLYELGYMESFEAWQDDKLVGGIWGFRYKGYFLVETMYYETNRASKAAFVHMIEHFRKTGCWLIDTMRVSDHFVEFGGTEIVRDEFLKMLSQATQGWQEDLRKKFDVPNEYLASTIS